MTEEGCRVAGWVGEPKSQFPSHISDEHSFSEISIEELGCDDLRPKSCGKGEGHRSDHLGLADVLSDPSVCGLFREFLKAREREWDLAFWREINNFKKIVSSSSSVIVGLNSTLDLRAKANDDRRNFLLQKVNELLTSYLNIGAARELKIASELREEVTRGVRRILVESNLNDELKHDWSRPDARDFHKILLSFKRVQESVFQSMSNLVPEVSKLFSQ